MVRAEVHKLKDNLALLRLSDDETRFFEGLWSIPEGVTYNAYILLSSEGLIIFDGWKRGFGELFIETMREIADPRDVRYVIVHHMEPDHSGSLRDLLSVSREAVVMGHSMTLDLMKSFYGITPKFRSVRDGERVAVGEHNIRFYHTPWTHWPDNIVSYLEEEKILFSCDLFGSYGIPHKVFFEELSEEEKRLFHWYAKKYFVSVIGHYIDWAHKNLSKILDLDLPIEIIAPGHGPLYRSPREIIELYKTLSSKTITRRKAVIIYTSMYGFVEEIVRVVAEELEREGFKHKTYKFTDKHRDSETDIITDLIDAESIIIATSTYDADIFHLTKYIVELINAKIPKNKSVILVTRYGWAPVAGTKLREHLKHFKIADVVELRGGVVDRERIREAIRKLLV